MHYSSISKGFSIIRYLLTWGLIKKSNWFNFRFKATIWKGYDYISMGKNNRFYPYSILDAGLNLNDLSIVIGDNNEFDIHSVLFAHGGFIIFGDDNFIGPRVQIQGKGGVTVGNNCLIAGNTFISSSNHDFSNPEIGHYRKEIGKPIVIEDGVWIGANCVITSGVRIGKGAVIGSGTIVVKNVEAHTIVAGNPAQVIKKYCFQSKKWIRP